SISNVRTRSDGRRLWRSLERARKTQRACWPGPKKIILNERGRGFTRSFSHEVNMRRLGQRLVVSVSLATFLLANTPGVLAALSACVPDRSCSCGLSACRDCCSQCAVSHQCSHSDIPSSGKPECSCQGAHELSFADLAVSPQPGGRHGPCPLGPSCPCECMWCSLAKITCCLLAAPQLLLGETLLGEDLAKSPLLLPPPPAPQLIRPPIR